MVLPGKRNDCKLAKRSIKMAHKGRARWDRFRIFTRLGKSFELADFHCGVLKIASRRNPHCVSLQCR